MRGTYTSEQPILPVRASPGTEGQPGNNVTEGVFYEARCISHDRLVNVFTFTGRIGEI